MPDGAKHHLKASMKGSWYNQEHRQDQQGTSVSSRKIPTESEQLQEENKGSIIVDLDILNSQISENTCCSKCYGKMSLSAIPSKQNGLCSSLLLKCQNVQCNHTSEFFTSKLCTNSFHSFEVNRSVVVGMRTIGKGRNAASKFCAAMNLPQPVSATPYSDHTKHITENAKSVLLQELENAAKQVHSLKESEEENLGPESVVDCGVTIDGSWLNRGLSSRHGFVTVISIDTGEVLDVHYMCSVCPECSRWEDKTSPEYLDWFLVHEPDCMLNQDGSAQSMETEGASILFNRSVQKYNLRYNPFIGDGDSKAFLRVLRDKPYGDIQIQKEECVGHIQKRMGTRLRNLITKYKGQKLMDGKPLSGPGRLTLAMVDSFQVWYGQALRKNKGDTNRMSTETMAILHHYSEDADHSYCPNGVNSWCKWKMDQETGDNTYTPVSNPLPAAVVQILKPVFDSLSDPNLLQGCKNCLTQNQNESLHHVVWGFAPKDQYHSAHEVDLAIILGVLTFNTGISKCMNNILPSCGLRFTEKMQNVFGKIDGVRIYEANHH